MAVGHRCGSIQFMSSIDELLKPFDDDVLTAKLRNRLEQIQEAIDEQITLDMKLAYDVLSGQPVLQVGMARLNQSGDGYLKPEMIENFTGQLTIGLVLDFIIGIIPA